MGSKGFFTMNFHATTGKRSALTWSPDNRVALACDLGVYVLIIKTSPTDFSSSFVVHKEFIAASKEVCSFDVGVDREALLKNLDTATLAQFMLDRSLSPNIGSSVSHKGCRRAIWSPVGGDSRGRCAIAVLSHDHRLTLHTNKLHGRGWQEVCCLSSRLHEISAASGYVHADNARPQIEKNPAFARYQRKVGIEIAEDLLNLQTRTYSLCAELIEWSQAIDGADGRLLDQSWVVDDQFPHDAIDIRDSRGNVLRPRKRRVFSFLFVFMKSGHLAIWKIFLPLSHEDDCELMVILYLGCSQPSAVSQMHPSSLADHSGLVAVGFNKGVVKLLRIDWSDPDDISVQLLPQDPWSDDDQLSVSNLHWFSDARLSCLVVLKENYVIALRVSTKGTVEQQHYIGGITCLGLTGCCKLDDSILVSSADGLLLKVTFGLEGEKLAIYPERVALNCSGQDFTQSGVAASPNGIFVILAETFSLSFDHLRARDPLRLHLLPAKTVSQAYDLMLESPLAELGEGHLLSGYHDCLECMRQGIASGDELPALLLQQVNARSRWKDFTDLHLKLTRFATDLLMAPTISKTAESVTQLEGAGRLLDNLIMWRHVKRTLVAWVEKEEKAPEHSSSKKRVAELASVLLMCEWLESVQPSLVEAQHVADIVEPDVLAQVRGRVAELNPEGDAERLANSCVVCGQRTLFPTECDEEGAKSLSSDPHVASCGAGHRFGRCCQSLLACEKAPYRKCIICGATSIDPLSGVASKEGLVKLLKVNCSFCDGLLVSI